MLLCGHRYILSRARILGMIIYSMIFLWLFLMNCDPSRFSYSFFYPRGKYIALNFIAWKENMELLLNDNGVLQFTKIEFP